MTVNRTNHVVRTSAAVALGVLSAASAHGAAGDLSGAAGKVFSVDLMDKCLRFLKQDVAYDPMTGEGTAWFTVHWTDGTAFRHVEERPNFAGIKGPVIAEFVGLDDASARALADGTPFRADRVVLRPDLKEAAGVAADGRSVMGWFTPREGAFSRDGVLGVGNRQIGAGVKRGGPRIAIQQARVAADLAVGSWKATLTGKRAGGRFVAEQIRLEPLVDPLAVDDPKLPRVLSVGDSISMNYESGLHDMKQSRPGGDFAVPVDEVHFWKAEAQAVLGQAAAEAVRRALKAP